jgi:hypothetical protein
MNPTLVKKAAKQAREYAGLLDPDVEQAAFAVLFYRLLGSEAATSPADLASDSGRSLKRGATPRTMKGKLGPLQRIRELAGDGFFKMPRTLKGTLEELKLRGHGYDKGLISKSLHRAVQEKLLRRTRGKEGGRDIYQYSDW